MAIKMQVTKNFKLSELEFSDQVPPELIANAVKALIEIISEFIFSPSCLYSTNIIMNKPLIRIKTQSPNLDFPLTHEFIDP